MRRSTEGNINRFIGVLERFVKQSQFIIMTHNKRTIAKADVLYGVTMEERGVSKLVGNEINSAASGRTARDYAQDSFFATGIRHGWERRHRTEI
jgi:hypothetical protein